VAVKPSKTSVLEVGGNAQQSKLDAAVVALNKETDVLKRK
jgi:hypothetical protein